MVVALACSAGGYTAVREILAALPEDFPAPIIVAQHRGPQAPEVLVNLLSLRAKLRVKTAAPMEVMRPRCVYVCPPGRHIEIAAPGVLHTWPGPRLDFVRPSCDLLFKSIAETYGHRGVCVVLTGCGADGAFATRNVRRAGGYVIAQDETSAAYPDMPRAAVELGRVDLTLPLKDIPFALHQLVEELALDETATAN